jgi:predicted NAD/FAD-binding protein
MTGSTSTTLHQASSSTHHTKNTLVIVEALLHDRDQKLRDIYAGLELAIVQKTQENDETKQRLQALKEDFLFNLKLLEERDTELERFESISEALRKEVFDRCVCSTHWLDPLKAHSVIEGRHVFRSLKSY